MRIFKLFFVFLAMFISSIAFSQKDTVNQIDSQGRKQGLWRKYNSNGKLKYVGFFKNDKPTGEFTYYYETGKVSSILIFSSPSFCKAKLYYPDGVNAQAIGYYRDKHKDSIWSYYDMIGGLIKTENYKNNKLNGVLKTYYPEGSLFEEINFKDSVKNGVWKQYHVDGKPKLEAVYINGELEGTFKIFYPSGNLNKYGVYLHSLQEGKWLVYNDNGTLQKTQIYVKGVLQQTEKEKELEYKQNDSLMNIKLPESVIDPSLENNDTQKPSNDYNPEDYY